MPKNLKRNARIIRAMTRMKKIIEEENLAAVVMLSTQDSTEYLLALTPKWSCGKTVDSLDGSYGIHFKAQQKDYPSKDEFERHIADTVGIFTGFLHLIKVVTEQINIPLGVLASKMDISSWFKKNEDTFPAPPHHNP